ncbi:hypothetical protein DPMN_194295 [Dreissena polymorpha]|uniref:Uncharacterized protein n=1 Tax=Dreissena polymorpha TaxID=45954 RepID=A0A9D3Y2F1_DREPO|nr:hypothetical protein DPMN_194295 [Dreissena polymorpha]
MYLLKGLNLCFQLSHLQEKNQLKINVNQIENGCALSPEQPAINSQAVQVLCCLLLISIIELEMKPLKLESRDKGLK